MGTASSAELGNEHISRSQQPRMFLSQSSVQIGEEMELAKTAEHILA